VRWADTGTQQAIEKVVQIGPRIGSERPDALFDLDAEGRGCIASYRRLVSYAPGSGATVLSAVSEGSGSSRPTAGPLESELIALGWPRWEARVAFPGIEAASIDDEDADLARRARAALAAQEAGTTTWQIVGDANAPRPGRDFGVGDTVYLDIAPQGRRDQVGTGGLVLPVRVLGWDLDLNSGRVTLIVWEDR